MARDNKREESEFANAHSRRRHALDVAAVDIASRFEPV